ncbi:MAG: oxidoreductase [Gammaproteobacteria bacterium]|nr:MAG: oxidoreductase [Gammaproteobacteria bacterium]
MSDSFQAIVARAQEDGKPRAGLETLSVADLPDEAVLVDVEYSTVNYKDGLAVTGAAPICQNLPMVCGIDLAGTVSESRSDAWRPGDRVLVNGYGLSERHWGGYSQRARVNPDFLVRIPEAFSSEQAMAIGTAGYTAMLAVNAIRDHGVSTERGPVLVTGAAGGVGSFAVLLLSALGYEVAASTGRPETADYLKGLGASTIVDRADLARSARPLEKEVWAAAVDSVGSTTLATTLAQLRYDGIVSACGLAAGADLPATVLPFILRNVRLQGIDSVMAPMGRRERAWKDLAALLDPDRFAAVHQLAPLSQVPDLCAAILAGKIRGRVVIDVNA